MGCQAGQVAGVETCGPVGAAGEDTMLALRTEAQYIRKVRTCLYSPTFRELLFSET